MMIPVNHLKGFLAAVLLATGMARAAPVDAPSHWETRDVRLSAGRTPTGARTVMRDEAPATQIVLAEGAPWMRLFFGECRLGQESYLTVTSLKDGSRQRLDARSLAEWNNSSAFFNGDRVLVELHAGPEDRDISAHVRALTAGEWVGGAHPQDGGSGATLCGADNRVASNDGRVGRIGMGGCTAWLFSNGAVLTAGHCADFDPDDDGPMLPDGVLDLAGVVQFNVPASQADGTTVAANANDQYPINVTNVQWRFDGAGQGLGKDWAVFGLNRNANTSQRAHVVQGFFRGTLDVPANNATVRVTGFGTDSTPAGTTGGRNAQNQTNQTHAGPYTGETASGADIRHSYSVDTEGGNSGSPIIWEDINFTIGIHTNGGCTTTGGANNGTSFEVDALEAALRNFPGANARYVDIVARTNTFDGSIFRPYNNVSDAVFTVPNGGIVSIVRGVYSADAGNTFAGARRLNRPMTLVAPVGVVSIGD